jgi:hypothetical protein
MAITNAPLVPPLKVSKLLRLLFIIEESKSATDKAGVFCAPTTV